MSCVLSYNRHEYEMKLMEERELVETDGQIMLEPKYADWKYLLYENGIRL